MGDASRPMRIRELAERLGHKSRKTGKTTPHVLYRLCATGALRHYKLGKNIYVTEQDFRDLMARCAVEPGARRSPDPRRSEAARKRQLAAEQANEAAADVTAR